MQLSRRIIEEFSYWLLLSLILFEVFLVLFYLGIVLLTDATFPPLDMVGNLSIPSLLQAGHRFTLGAIAFIFFREHHSPEERPSRFFLLTITVLLFYATLDELFKITLWLDRWFPVWGSPSGIGGYVLMFFGMSAIFYRDLLALLKLYRRETLYVLLGMLVFSLSEFSPNLLNYEELQPYLNHLFHQRELTIVFADKVKMAFSKFYELLGESLMLYGVLLGVAKRFPLKKTVSE